MYDVLTFRPDPPDADPASPLRQVGSSIRRLSKHEQLCEDTILERVKLLRRTLPQLEQVVRASQPMFPLLPA